MSSAGAARFAIANILSKPIRTAELLAAMAPLRLRGGEAPVMVIDDDPLALALMRAALDSIGIQAVGFTDAREALEEIDRHRPAAIVLDLMMPVVDGFAVLHALSNMPAWRDTPVFVWTSMILTDEQYLTLTRSAEAIIGRGGGELSSVLASLRRRQLATLVSPPAAGG